MFPQSLDILEENELSQVGPNADIKTRFHYQPAQVLPGSQL